LFDDFYNHVSIILSIVNEIKSNNKVFKMWLNNNLICFVNIVLE
jgi:hypothetical protein